MSFLRVHVPLCVSEGGGVSEGMSMKFQLILIAEILSTFSGGIILLLRGTHRQKSTFLSRYGSQNPFFLCLWNKIMFISRSLRAYCLLACYFGLFQHSQHIHIFLSKSKDEWKPLYFRKLVFLSFEKHFMLLMMMMMCFEFWLYALRVVEFFKIIKIILSQTSAS